MSIPPTNPVDLVVIHLAGGNDYLNTLVPFGDPLYYDHRPTLALHPDSELPRVSIAGEQPPSGSRPAVLPLDEHVGLHGGLGVFKRLYDAGQLAVFMGVGYPDRDRSHFRSLDIWHTAEPASISNEGWLGKTADRLDPAHQHPVLMVNVGRRLPLALSYPGVMAASLDTLADYNIFPQHLDNATSHSQLASAARELYESPGLVDPWQRAQGIGRYALDGIEILRDAARSYQSTVAYPPFNRLAQRLRSIAQIQVGGVGTRIFYTSHDGYDTHQDQLVTQQRLHQQLGTAIETYLADLATQDLERETVILVFSEFGRRIAENGDGTDHGGAGVAFLIGSQVLGGLYGDYPSLLPGDQIDGDLRPTIDFREVYASILDQFIGLDAHEIVDPRIAALGLRRAA